MVAPRVGAWIEMIQTSGDYRRMIVAPRVGAWIEITLSLSVALTPARRSPCGSVD